MKQAKSRTAYFAQLREGLNRAGVDLQWLYKDGHVDPNTMSRLLYYLSGTNFSHPEELQSNGYPEAAVRSAEQIAERQVAVSLSAISEIYTAAIKQAAQTVTSGEDGSHDIDEGLDS